MNVKDIEDELLSLCKITPVSLRIPSDREVATLWKRDLKISSAPPTERDPIIMQMIERATRLWMGMRNKGTEVVSAPVTKPVKAQRTVSGTEARIREMRWPEVDELCRRNSLVFKREGGNAGILTMRAKNAVYAALRRGVNLK